jgi:uncharacterized cupredoxin-like copper-binding protein
MIIVLGIIGKFISTCGGANMKKILTVFILVILGAVLLVGCTPKEPETSEPEYLSQIDLDIGEWFIKPAVVYAKAGDVTFTVTNTGNKRHEFMVSTMNPEDKVLINGGKSQTITVNLEAGEYEVYNPIPGSKNAGMVATVMVA